MRPPGEGSELRLLIAGTPAAGHVNPLLGLTRMAVRRGHEAFFMTGSRFAAAVEDAGAGFVPLVGGADLALERVEEAFPERAALAPGAEQLRFDFERAFIDIIPAQALGLRAAAARLSPDVIVTDSLFLGRLAMARDAGRPPVVALGITVLPLPRPDGAPFGPGLPPARDGAERARYAGMAREWAAAFEGPVGRRLRGVLDQFGAPAAFPSVAAATVYGADAYLQPTVRSFEYDFEDMPPWIRFVGALPPPRHAPPGARSWEDGLDGSRRVVLVTQGTAANFDFGQLVDPALDALAARPDLDVVVTTGGRPVGDVRAAPRRGLRIETFADYGRLMPRLSLLVTNGGYGTVSLALGSGVPIVACGLTEDKAEVGARIAWSGAGIAIPSSSPSSAALGAAIDAALGEPSYRARARALAADFAAIDAEAEIFSAIGALVARPHRRATPVAGAGDHGP